MESGESINPYWGPGFRVRFIRATATALARTGRMAWSQEADMKTFDRITRDPAMLGGQPTVRGMRLTVRRVVEAVALYPNRDELFAE